MKLIACIIGLWLSAICSGQTTVSKSAVPMIDATSLLRTELPEKEAVIWYTGQDGFTIKTKSHLLVFDFNGGGGGRGTVPGTSLATGSIDPIEIKDFDVVVFVTHSDGDQGVRFLIDEVRARKAWEDSRRVPIALST